MQNTYEEEKTSANHFLCMFFESLEISSSMRCFLYVIVLLSSLDSNLHCIKYFIRKENQTYWIKEARLENGLF